MIKRLVMTIWAAAIIAMAIVTQASAATEFVCTIQSSGGDARGGQER